MRGSPTWLHYGGYWLCDRDEISPPTQDLCIPFRVLVRLFDYLDYKIVHGGSCYQFQLAVLMYCPSQSIDFGNATSAGAKLSVLLSGTNGTLLAALTATFGIYIISSFLYGDPYHIFTSLVSFLLSINVPSRNDASMQPAYLCLAPSFTNVLNVYAFCNLLVHFNIVFR